MPQTGNPKSDSQAKQDVYRESAPKALAEGFHIPARKHTDAKRCCKRKNKTSGQIQCTQFIIHMATSQHTTPTRKKHKQRMCPLDYKKTNRNIVMGACGVFLYTIFTMHFPYSPSVIPAHLCFFTDDHQCVNHLFTLHLYSNEYVTSQGRKSRKPQFTSEKVRPM